MAALTFIGDEVSGLAYRLAGMLVMTPSPGKEAAALQQAGEEAELIVITAECAARVPRAVLHQALAAPTPLVLVVPDVRGHLSPPDPAARLRAQLGMKE